MREVSEHKAYQLLKETYHRVCLDYVILRADDPYQGLETHKKAVIEAFRILDQRFACDDCGIDINPDNMTAEKYDTHSLFALPPDSYDKEKRKKHRSHSIPTPLPYWYAFLEPPHGTPYFSSDFITFNDVLFPDKDSIEVYRWNDGFSSYFDDGKEWWGTGLWSVSDRKNNIAVIIGASLTD